MNLNILWHLVIIAIIINFVIYLVEPLKYSEAKQCIRLPCRPFTLFNQILGFIFDICVILVISKMLNFKSTVMIYILFIFFAFLILTSWFVAKPVIDDNTLNPPPQLFLNKDTRIVMNFILLFLDLIIFFLLFTIKSNNNNNNNAISSGWGIFKNKGYGITNLINTRFGGNIDGNRFFFFCGWFASLGIFQNIYNIYKSVTYHPTYYNLPLSWRK